jgi:hypothetical protein
MIKRALKVRENFQAWHNEELPVGGYENQIVSDGRGDKKSVGWVSVTGQDVAHFVDNFPTESDFAQTEVAGRAANPFRKVIFEDELLLFNQDGKFPEAYRRKKAESFRVGQELMNL